MKVDQRLYITLNLAAESHSLMVLTATLDSILQQIDHETEIDEQLKADVSTLFQQLIENLQKEKAATEGIKISLSYSEGFLKITFAYSGKEVLTRLNANSDNQQIQEKLQRMPLEFQRKDNLNLLVLARQIIACQIA